MRITITLDTDTGQAELNWGQANYYVSVGSQVRASQGHARMAEITDGYESEQADQDARVADIVDVFGPAIADAVVILQAAEFTADADGRYDVWRPAPRGYGDCSYCGEEIVPGDSAHEHRNGRGLMHAHCMAQHRADLERSIAANLQHGTRAAQKQASDRRDACYANWLPATRLA